MKRKIYLSCDKTKKEMFRERIIDITDNVIIVDDIHEAGICLVIGTQTKEMHEDMRKAEEEGINVKEVGENLINTGVYQSILNGQVRVKDHRKYRGMEL